MTPPNLSNKFLFFIIDLFLPLTSVPPPAYNDVNPLMSTPIEDFLTNYFYADLSLSNNELPLLLDSSKELVLGHFVAYYTPFV